MNIKLSDGRELPIEMHKVRIVQKTTLPPIDQRLKAMEEGGYNTFLLRSRDIFIDGLTDSGTNAMSDNQLAAMMVADDAYAGGESYYRLVDAVKEVLGFEYCMPAHQGRAAEHLLAKTFVKPGQIVPMNYHFTTTRAHIDLAGGSVVEIFGDEAMNTQSTCPFKGNIDIDRLHALLAEHGPEKIAYIRMEATTNLIGGQPFSLANMREVREITRKLGIMMVLDASLISENAYFIKVREAAYADASVGDIIREMMSLCDIMYLSGRKSTAVRGGLIATNSRELLEQMKPWLPVYEGFLTYGGMSSKEVEAMAVGIREMTELAVASSSADLIRYLVEKLEGAGVPVVTPPGGLAGHVDARRLLPQVPSLQYPAGAAAAAIYLVSGVRTMERGTISTDRDRDGNEVAADLELARIAVPRRVYSLSHMEYIVDRLKWLTEHAHLVGGLRFIEEPPVLRFFFGKLEAIDGWDRKLADAFKADFGTEC